MHIRIPKEVIPFLTILTLFGIVNLVYNWPLWKQIMWDSSRTYAFHGELVLLHLSAETVYQNILAGVNPFAPNPYLLYPFQMSYTVNDLAPINGFFFLVLRPFLSIHQSISIIGAASIFIANIAMYSLLRKLRISRPVAALIGLSFGFTPYLAARMGAQMTFNSIYLFPLGALSFVGLIQAQRKRTSVFYAFLLGITAVLFVLSNLNYTIIFGLIVGLYILSSLFVHRIKGVHLLLAKLPYLLMSAGIAFGLLLPWFSEVWKLRQAVGIPRGSAGGTLEFSGDILGFFIPSQWNYFYKPMITYFDQLIPSIVRQFEGFVYPGGIILLSMLLAGISWKKYSQNIQRSLLPHIFVAASGALLALGPQLQIATKRIDIPMPFSIITHIPLLQNFRSPGRLMIIAIFAGSIAAAYILNKIVSEKSGTAKGILVVVLIAFVLVDQAYIHTPAMAQHFPSKIYKKLADIPEEFTIIDIPYTVRDGLQYTGDINAIYNQLGQFIHKKPIIGSHTGRINNYIFDYHRNDPFLGFIAHIVDPSQEHAALVDPLGVQNGYTPDIANAQKTIDFLGIKAIVLKHDMPYSSGIAELITKMGFEKDMIDGPYTLYLRNHLEHKSHTCVDLGDASQRYYIGRGWHGVEGTGRWIEGKKATILMKPSSNNQGQKLKLVGKSLVPQKARIFWETEHITEAEFISEMQEYDIPLSVEQTGRIQRLHIVFESMAQPTSIIKDSTDTRFLSGFFETICIE